MMIGEIRIVGNRSERNDNGEVFLLICQEILDILLLVEIYRLIKKYGMRTDDNY